MPARFLLAVKTDNSRQEFALTFVYYLIHSCVLSSNYKQIVQQIQLKGRQTLESEGLLATHLMEFRYYTHTDFKKVQKDGYLAIDLCLLFS